MSQSNGKRVLISGASFAGLSSAFWMCELGYDVSIVEVAPGIRMGGTAVNIRGKTIPIVERMGLLKQIQVRRLHLRRWEFKDADDRTVRSLTLQAEGAPPPEDDYEIERDVLLNLLLETVKDRCTITYGDSIVALSEANSQVEARFKSGRQALFDLVLGCDGSHSGVRKLCFGEEAKFVHYLQQYYAIAIVDRLLIERDTAQLYNEPCKAVMLNAYKNKTDIVLSFVSEAQIPYDYRDEAQHRQLIAAQFASVGWRAPELLREMMDTKNFFFDKLCQIRMPTWSRGRVVLVGDAAYCASPAAGMGGSLAIDGAAALGEAMKDAVGDHELAFRRYEDSFRPFVSEVQSEAVRVGLETLVPRTEQAIQERNNRSDLGF